MEGGLPEIEPFKELTPEQKSVFEKLSDSLQNGTYRTYLLEGITGRKNRGLSSCSPRSPEIRKIMFDTST